MHARTETVILGAQGLQHGPTHSHHDQPGSVAGVQAVQEFVRAHAEALILTPEGLQREFFISFVNVPHLTKLRHLMARHLGQLVCFAGAPPETPGSSHAYP